MDKRVRWGKYGEGMEKVILGGALWLSGTGWKEVDQLKAGMTPW